MADLVERCAEAIWSKVPTGYGMTVAEAESYAKAVLAIALEEAAKVAETAGVTPELNVWAGGPEWYRHGKDIAVAIRALKAEGESR